MSDLTPRAGDWAARFSIQQMKPDHYAGKGYVHYQAWRESYRGLMGDQVLDGQTLEHCREMAAAYPENTLVLLDQNRSDQVAGFACYAPEARSFVSLPEASEIVALYLLHAYKGLGLGCRLMEACLSRLPHPAVSLFVLRDNLPAIGFYRHMGFRFTGHYLTQSLRGEALTELEMALYR